MVAGLSPTGGEIHGHDHNHHGGQLSDVTLRVRALESLLIEKGYVDPAALDAIVETYETKIGPRNGARVVARSWVDPAYREWLLDDATAAIKSLGYAGRQGEHMVAVEVLGLPPVWYKSAPYRSRAVIDPHGVLAEFGVSLPPRPKSESGIPPPKSATSSCRCAPPGRTAGARGGSLRW